MNIAMNRCKLPHSNELVHFWIAFGLVLNFVFKISGAFNEAMERNLESQGDL